MVIVKELYIHNSCTKVNLTILNIARKIICGSTVSKHMNPREVYTCD